MRSGKEESRTRPERCGLQVIPEGQAELGGRRFLQADEGVPALPAEVAAGSAADFAFFHVVTDIALAVVEVQGISGRSSTSKSSVIQRRRRSSGWSVW